MSANYMLALVEAVGRDQSTLSQQQITDALTTQNFADVELANSNIWNGPNGVLAKDAAAIQKEAAKKDPNQEVLQSLQAQFQKHSAQAQAEQSQIDGTVQAMQGQAGQDSSNLQVLTGLVSAVNTILQTLVSLLR